MTCKEFVDFLMDYLDRQLPEQSRTEFERHIEECPECVPDHALVNQLMKTGISTYAPHIQQVDVI